LCVDTIEPWLVWTDHVVLRIRPQAVIVGLTRDGVDPAYRYFHRAGPPRNCLEREPQSLPLIHGNEDTTSLAPSTWDSPRIPLHLIDRECTEPRRQRVCLTVIWDTKRALERDGKVSTDPDSTLLDYYSKQYVTVQIEPRLRYMRFSDS
jgi:hypothetical protein